MILFNVAYANLIRILIASTREKVLPASLELDLVVPSVGY